MLCEQCGKPMRGYIVRKKKIHYYKCGTTGCCANENAKRLNDQFYHMMKQFEFDETLIDYFRAQVEAKVMESAKNILEEIEAIQTQIAEVEKKIKKLEKKYIEEDIDKELYTKYRLDYLEEKKKLEESLTKYEIHSSNLQSCIDQSLKDAMNVGEKWLKSTYSTKQRLQRLAYPEGIFYDKKIRGCRTIRENEVWKIIASISKYLRAKKEGTHNSNVCESLSVERKGFEPLL